MKHFGSKPQSVTDAMLKGREETPGVSDVSPFEDSQPIPSTWSDDVIQLAEKGSPILTTALGGLVSTGQEELTAVPTNIQCVIAYSTSSHVKCIGLFFFKVWILTRQRHVGHFEWVTQWFKSFFFFKLCHC